MDSFSQRFKYLRDRVKGWTQDEAAEKLGVSRSTIAGYESDTKNRIPREETLHKIADAFETTIDFLLGRTDDSSLPETSADPSIPPEQKEFLKWVEENLEGSFFYDFHKSPEEQKEEMMETLRMVWELEKKKRGRRLGDKSQTDGERPK